MKFGKPFAVLAAATLAAAPIAAQAEIRASAPVEGESELGSPYTVLIILAIVAIGIGIAASGEEPQSP